MKHLATVTAFIVFVCFNHTILGQQLHTSPAMAAAGELLNQKKFDAAAAAYEAIVKNEPQNGPAWYQLAAARYSLKQYQAAADAYLKNITISNSPFAMYNLASVCSLMGDKDKAVEWLQKAIDNPKMVLAVMNFDDPDLANVRSDVRVAVMRDKVDRKVRPCMYMDEAKQLNFWIGEWDVFNPQGRHDGTSSIQSIASGCGILENWQATYGGGGKSINFYDPSAGRWFQYWIGSSGGPQRYSGIYRDGALRYEGEATSGSGTKMLTKLTFSKLDDNTVRQLAESSADGGKTWQTTYDYKYVRKTPTK